MDTSTQLSNGGQYEQLPKANDTSQYDEEEEKSTHSSLVSIRSLPTSRKASRRRVR